MDWMKAFYEGDLDADDGLAYPLLYHEFQAVLAKNQEQVDRLKSKHGLTEDQLDAVIFFPVEVSPQDELITPVVKFLVFKPDVSARCPATIPRVGNKQINTNLPETVVYFPSLTHTEMLKLPNEGYLLWQLYNALLKQSSESVWSINEQQEFESRSTFHVKVWLSALRRRREICLNHFKKENREVLLKHPNYFLTDNPWVTECEP